MHKMITDWHLNPIHSGAILRLQNLLEKSKKFNILIIQYNNPSYRAGLIQFLNQDKKISQLDLTDTPNFADFEKSYDKIQQTAIIHLINLENLHTEQQQAFFRGINYHREHLARHHQGALIFWLPAYLIKEMALKAPDFWAWREQLFDFSLEQKVSRHQQDLEMISFADLSKKQTRIKEIQDFLATNNKQNLVQTDLKQELGRLYHSVGEDTQAITQLSQAIQAYTDFGEALSANITKRDLAKVLVKQGKDAKALALLNKKILPTFEKLQEQTEIAKTYAVIADILKSQGQLEQALDILQNKTLRLFQHLKNDALEVKAMVNIADLLTDLGRYQKAISLYQKSIQMAEKYQDNRNTAVIEFQLANVYCRQYDFDKALVVYQKVLKNFQALNESHLIATAYHQIGMVYEKQGLFRQSEKAYLKSLKIRRQQQDPAGEANSLGQLALLYQAWKKPKQAISYCKNKIELCIQLGDQLNEGSAHSNLAYMLFETKAYNKAHREILKAINCKQSFGLSAEPWKSYYLLFKIEQQKGNQKAANTARQQAIQSFLSYRQAGGENHTISKYLASDVLQVLLKQEDSIEISEKLQALLKAPDLQTHRVFFQNLLAILQGSRSASLSEDPALYYEQAVELKILLAALD